MLTWNGELTLQLRLGDKNEILLTREEFSVLQQGGLQRIKSLQAEVEELQDRLWEFENRGDPEIKKLEERVAELEDENSDLRAQLRAVLDKYEGERNGS